MAVPCVWKSAPRTADVTVTKIAGYVRVRILMKRWLFRIFGINSLKFLSTFYTPGAYALTRSQAMQRSRAVHACGALRLVGGCIRRHNNVGGVTAGQAPHNSSNVGVVTAGQVGHNSSTYNEYNKPQVKKSLSHPPLSIRKPSLPTKTILTDFFCRLNFRIFATSLAVKCGAASLLRCEMLLAIRMVLKQRVKQSLQCERRDNGSYR